MSFTPDFLDEIRARTPLADIIGRRVNLIRRGREYVALCPFHKEKTPSFTINEDKGFFHCFGCGAHGDTIGFEMRIDNLTFPEAVERLARAAGLALPARTPEERERAKERTSLYGVLEAACAWFEAQLVGAGGKAAREYLGARGVDDATIATFRLGWAPDSRSALKQALARQGVSEATTVTAGLLIQPEGGGAAYDRFRGRIVFPITDRGGRVVGFGGRALGDGEPKYLNSPETPLFRKRSLLYGLALARKPARDANEVIVAEGYMDVIALHRAGFGNAVAPLGTALTEDQIQELWRLAPEPVVCFDGDAAGHRAAYRAAERALPLLKPGRSLRFVALPVGEDPDSLIAKRGAQALREALAQARPLADLLWEMEIGDRSIDTPERRAGVKKRLETVADQIRDLTVRGYYKGQFQSRLRGAIRGGAPATGRRVRRGVRAFDRDRPPERPLADSLGSGAEGLSERRERLLVTMLLDDPGLLTSVAEDFAALAFATPELDRLRRAILDVASGISDLDSETLRRHLSARGMSAAVDRLSAPRDWPGRWLEDGSTGAAASRSERVREWRHVLSHQRVVALKAELHAAVADHATSESEDALKRIDALRREIEQSARDEGELEEPGMIPGGGNAV